jgi:hypothetical protein
MCASLRKGMDKYSETLLSDESIKSALQEVEQFYENLAMINQFFAYPLPMPKPHKCISQLTYRLAVVFSKSKNIIADIKSLFKKDPFLTDIFEEIKRFCYNN